VSVLARTPGLDRLLWTAAIVVGASLVAWPTLPVWIPLLLVACVAWRLAIAVLGWAVPPRSLRLVLATLAFLGVLAQYRTINGIEAGSALLVVMVALKFLESHAHRDQLVLMIIAYFLVFASLLTERSLWSAAYLLAFVWLTTVALLQVARRSALLPTRETARAGTRLLLQAAPVMLVLFVLFPRLPGPLWGMAQSSSSASTGLSDTMSPGDITALGLSDEIAFRVEFLSAPPGPSELYWRGPVLSSFNGRTWSRPEGMRRNVARTLEHRGAPVDYRVTLEPAASRWAVALDMPARWSASRTMVMGSDYQLRMFSFDRRPVRLDYTVTSYTDYRALEPLTEAEQRRFSSLPSGNNPRTRALAESWLADNPTPREIVARALAFFSSAQFVYTLTPPRLGQHAVDEFLFETREGFCEHYASAFAVMLRAAGIPARVVTGYQGGELNVAGGYYIVRQSDAHAWTEAWLTDEGWVRIDPIAVVAPDRIEDGSGRAALEAAGGGVPVIGRFSWVRDALLLWDAANVYWTRWVLGYGPELQRDLLAALGFDDAQWTRRLGVLLGLAIAATALVSIVLTFAIARAYRTRRRIDPAQRLFTAFTRRLAALDVAPRGATEAPAAYGRRAATALPQAADAIERIVDAYLRARYEPDPDRAALAELRTRVGGFAPR